jgi:hypothetical protein
MFLDEQVVRAFTGRQELGHGTFQSFDVRVRFSGPTKVPTDGKLSLVQHDDTASRARLF